MKKLVKYVIIQVLNKAKIEAIIFDYLLIYFKSSSVGTVRIKEITLNVSRTVIAENAGSLEMAVSEIALQIANQEGSISSLQNRTTQLEDQLALISQQNQSIIDFAKVFNPETMVYKDLNGGINLGEGKLEADGIVAGVFTVKVRNGENPMFGEATIKKGENKIIVVNENIKETSLINITLKSDPGNLVPFISRQSDGQFEINVKEEVVEDVKINWWIMQTQ